MDHRRREGRAIREVIMNHPGTGSPKATSEQKLPVHKNLTRPTTLTRPQNAEESRTLSTVDGKRRQNNATVPTVATGNPTSLTDSTRLALNGNKPTVGAFTTDRNWVVVESFAKQFFANLPPLTTRYRQETTEF